MISVKKVNNRPLNFLERIYLPEIVRGIAVTARHFFTNLFRPKNIITVRYPEQASPLPGAANQRTRHRLKLRADGSPKCVACFMCQTACPAYCIRIEAAEYAENSVEKYPAVFDIDLSRCVMCAMCVEACPEDAIAMDTREIPGGALTRGEMLLTKEDLLRNLPGEPSELGASNRLANDYLEGKK
ncbi:MAG: NADH-quinone oxidoreductase subunit I [Elusimicrobiales bacterium]|nr:NADH-quinone oxidoreductase subunit I [Elusimicrobiales bacterium]